MLVLKPSGSTFILESQGSYLQDIADPDEKKRKLFDYRREMNEFAAFLKYKFFNQTNYI